MRKLIFLIAISLFVLCGSNAQNYDNKIQEIDNYIENARQQWKAPGLSVAIVKDGEVLICKGYGEKKLGLGDMVDKQTVFRIASTTKVFTAAAMGILVDSGKVDWDDKVLIISRDSGCTMPMRQRI